jgi:polyisoprenoid-binding protein YceI
MKKALNVLGLVLILFSEIFAQGFKVKATGDQTFNFEDKAGRNQTTFFSSMPVEDINGMASGVSGYVTFDIKNFASTLKGKITIATSSLKSGIALRDEHMLSAGWLDAEKYPEITFTIKKVTNAKNEADNKLTAKIVGDYTMRGITKEVTADAIVTYLDENEKTKMRTPGDLLGVKADFTVKLSDFGVKNDVIGNKVADTIEVGVNITGSNAKK